MGVYSGNRTLLGESVITSSGHVLDLALEAQRNDLNMFNAVINLDLTEAYNEAGLISLDESYITEANEEGKKSILKKIKEAFDKIAAWIKSAVANFIAKIKNIVANDNKIIAKYNVYFKGAKKDLIKDIKISYRPMKKFDAIEIMDKKNSRMKAALGNIDSAKDKDSIDKSLKDIMDANKENKLDSAGFEAMLFSDQKQEGYVLSDHSDQLEMVIRWMDGGKTAIANVKQHEKKLLNELDLMKKQLKIDARGEDDELETARLNAKYRATSQISTLMSKFCNMMVNGYARQLAAARRAYISVGSKAAKKENGATVAENESALDEMILGECSDFYMETALMSI